MHPFCRLSATSSPEGQILAALCFEVLMRPKAEQRANFPLRGKSRAAGIGVHFHAPQARLFGLTCRCKAAYKSHRPKGDTTTLSHVVAVKPKNLKNLRLRELLTLTLQACPCAIPPPSAAEGGCRPLSEANTTLLHNPRRSRAPSPSEPRAAAAPCISISKRIKW